jgi:hypothetical protein
MVIVVRAFSSRDDSLALGRSRQGSLPRSFSPKGRPLGESSKKATEGAPSADKLFSASHEY